MRPKEWVSFGTTEMVTSVVLPLDLRVNGLMFHQVWLVEYQFDRAKRYTILIEDPVFGKLELSSNMIVEWKRSSRWYRTSPSLLVDHLLSKGAKNGKKATRRNRSDDGCGD
jgi:hypothetical protein